MPSSGHGRIWCLKTIGSNACRVMRHRIDASKPLAFFMHVECQYVRLIWCLKTIGCYACTWDGSDAINPLFFQYNTIGTCWISSAKEPMVDSQTDLFFARQMTFIAHLHQKNATVCKWDNPSGHQPLVLWPTFFNCHFDVSSAQCPDWTFWCLIASDGSDALKPLVLTHAEWWDIGLMP